MHSEPLHGYALNQLFKRHPWHGVPLGAEAPALVTCYVEIVPTDTVKYELDKLTGHLKIDRPQKYSSVCPTLYGLLPQTLCGERVAQACRDRTGRSNIVGDGDPMDVCVLSERPVSHGDILLRAIPIGGLRMIDRGQADDKIIAVLKDDPAYGDWSDIYQCPPTLLDRLRHYFLTYKEVPGESGGLVEIAEVYGRRAAHDVIDRSREDYAERFGVDRRWLDIGGVLEQAFQDVHRLPDAEGDAVAEQRDGGARDVVGKPP